MARYAGCLALAAIGSLASAQVPDEQRTFSERLLPQFEAAFPGAAISVDAEDPLTLSISGLDGWDDARVNLHRIFAFCANASADECTAISSEYVANISQGPPPTKAADLRVLVRDAGYMETIRRDFGSSGALPYHRAIGEDLFAILAFDSPKAIMLAMPATVAELGLAEDDAWQIARTQSAAALPALPDGSDLRTNAALFQDFEYLPSMLAETDAWQAVSRAAGPDLFMTVISDSNLFVGVMPDGAMLEGLRLTVEQDCAAQARCVSPHVYRFRDGGWVVAR